MKKEEPARIHSETYIPITWLVTAVVFVMGWTATGAFWISSVNDRLGRIEERLGIRPVAKSSLILDAQAGGQ